MFGGVNPSGMVLEKSEPFLGIRLVGMNRERTVPASRPRGRGAKGKSYLPNGAGALAGDDSGT